MLDCSPVKELDSERRPLSSAGGQKVNAAEQFML